MNKNFLGIYILKKLNMYVAKKNVPK